MLLLIKVIYTTTNDTFHDDDFTSRIKNRDIIPGRTLFFYIKNIQ